MAYLVPLPEQEVFEANQVPVRIGFPWKTRTPSESEFYRWNSGRNQNWMKVQEKKQINCWPECISLCLKRGNCKNCLIFWLGTHILYIRLFKETSKANPMSDQTLSAPIWIKFWRSDYVTKHHCHGDLCLGNIFWEKLLLVTIIRRGRCKNISIEGIGLDLRGIPHHPPCWAALMVNGVHFIWSPTTM